MEEKEDRQEFSERCREDQKKMSLLFLRINPGGGGDSRETEKNSLDSALPPSSLKFPVLNG